MARAIRDERPGATYHITSRGNRRERIYESDEVRAAWPDCATWRAGQ